MGKYEMSVEFRRLACDVMRPDCPARAILALLAEKWALLIVHALSEQTMRTGALRRRIGGISEKMLIQTLKRLEGAGLVVRLAPPEVPPRVEYSLTDLGRSLSPLVTALDEWVETHALEMVQPPDRRHQRLGSELT